MNCRTKDDFEYVFNLVCKKHKHKCKLCPMKDSTFCNDDTVSFEDIDILQDWIDKHKEYAKNSIKKKEVNV